MSTAANTNTGATTEQLMADAAAKADAAPTPRPDLNGRLVQVPGLPQVYLVINGYRRWIPDYDTFLNLFPGNATIQSDTGVGLISEGPALSSGAVLAKSSDDVRIYLVTNGMKMWIPSPAIFQLNQFNSATVLTVVPVIMKAVPTGPDIQAPTQA